MTQVTFSEQSVGTSNPEFVFSDNVLRTRGVIVNDSAQPGSPALAASSSYLGPVFLYFDRPVGTISLNAGYFDSIGSTRIEFRDASGTLLQSVRNTSLGVTPFTFTSTVGIRSVFVIDESADANGFSVDTVDFGAPVTNLAPPVVAAGAVLAPDRNYGTVGASTLVFRETLGGGDAVDGIVLNVASAGTATFTVSLDSNPSNSQVTQIALTAGLNQFTFTPPQAYVGATGYTAYISVNLPTSDKDKAMDEWISDRLENAIGGLLQFQETKFELLALMEKSVSNADDAVKLLGKIGKAYEVLGFVFDIAAKADAVAHAQNYRQELYAQTIDAFVGFGVAFGATVGFTFAGGPLAGLLGGVSGSLVYSYGLSDRVKAELRADYASRFGTNIDLGQSVAIGGETVVAVADNGSIDLAALKFDPAYYLASHADVRAALASGQFASAYLHYAAVGAALGYAPAQGVAPIPAGQIATHVDAEGARQGYNNALFTLAAGTMVGDTLSVLEARVADIANQTRVYGSEAGVAATLSTLANRVARDVVLNNLDGLQAVGAAGTPAAGVAVLSNGKAITAAFAGLVGLPSGFDFTKVSAFAVVSPSTDPATVLAALFNNSASAQALLGLDTRSFGIGEFGGVWVILASTLAPGTLAATDTAPVSVVLPASDGSDTLYAGGGQADFRGGDGADDIAGGIYADRIDGGDGDDVIDGGGGADVIEGGAGNDRLTARTLPVVNERPDIVKAAATVNGSIATAVNLDGAFDLAANAVIDKAASVPHATVLGTASSVGEYYRFTVTAAGTVGRFDIDGTSGFDSILRIYSATGTSLASADDISSLDRGSTSTNDAYLTYTFTAAGTYYVQVGSYSGSLPTNATYQLNISLEQAALSYSADAVSLSGGAGDDTLLGGAGNDMLSGGTDGDVLIGGIGADTQTGGSGADEFRGTRAELNGDTIVDLGGGDRIHVTDAGAGFGMTQAGRFLTFSTGERLTLGNDQKVQVTVAADGGTDIRVLRAVDADWTGDGRSDIVWRNVGGALTTWHATATGFDGATGFGATVSVDWKIAGNGDFDGDGRADILWRNDNGRITDWVSTGGGFNGATGVDYYVGTDWRVASVGDFDGDGRADILWRNDNGRITDWVSTGSSFNGATGVDYYVGTDWKVAGTGDFDDDGRDDILWRNDNGRIVTWAGTGAGFNGATGVDYQLTGDWKVAAVADFNGDGRDDILWRNDNGRLTEWFATVGGGFAQAPFNAQVATAWSVADTGDYNGDGGADILWRNTDGSLTDWLSNGQGFDTSPVTFNVGTEWAVWG